MIIRTATQASILLIVLILPLLSLLLEIGSLKHFVLFIELVGMLDVVVGEATQH